MPTKIKEIKPKYFFFFLRKIIINLLKNSMIQTWKTVRIVRAV